MQTDIPKQYLPLGPRPLLSETIYNVGTCPLVEVIFLVHPAGDGAYCRREVLAPFDLDKKVRLVAGGNTRQSSVFNGLRAIAAHKSNKNDGIVVIHDGVRPFVKSSQIVDCIATAEKRGSCILALPVQDTLKRVNGDGLIEKTVDRKALWMAQTPQAFRFDLIWRIHQKARHNKVIATDDASLIEYFGGRVQVIPGSNWNIKITTPADLDFARKLVEPVVAQTVSNSD
jgi:2-C-methyl-D-erythritol 4-phosphate cytidylyltransferase